jgi:hypothetical protein
MMRGDDLVGGEVRMNTDGIRPWTRSDASFAFSTLGLAALSVAALSTVFIPFFGGYRPLMFATSAAGLCVAAMGFRVWQQAARVRKGGAGSIGREGRVAGSRGI